MKKQFILLIFIISSSFGFGQNDSQKLPPFEMLPQKAGEVKEIYELPSPTIYQIYDIKGKLLKDSIAEFIDLTMFEKGTYFISYNGENHKYLKKTDPPKNLTKPKKCN